MKFSIFVLASIHISILKDLCSTFILDTIDKIAGIVLIIRNFDSSVAMPFALSPGAKVLNPVGFDLFAGALLKPIRPVSFVNYIILF